MNRWANILIKRVYTVIKVFLFKSLFFAALHLFKELCKSCLVIPLPCVLTLKSLSLILGISLDLSLVTIKFWLLKTLSQLQVWSGKVNAYWANLIISGTSSLWNSPKYARYVPKVPFCRYIASIFLTLHKRLWVNKMNEYRFGLWCLTPLSTLFQLYRGDECI
jgi:hypothetical protein